MFIGIQKGTPCFLGQSKSELENLPCVVLDEIREVDFAEMYNGKIYLNAESLTGAKQDFIRSIRNAYLEKYVDPVVSNALHWNDMPEADKQAYIDYRQYLLNYTAQDNWYESKPLTFTEWRQ